MDLSWVPGAVLGTAALVVSVLSYRRAGRAHAAENEFRDVRWEHRLRRDDAGRVVFALKNVGSTDAVAVRVRVRHDEGHGWPRVDFMSPELKAVPHGSVQELVVAEAVGPEVSDVRLTLSTDVALSYVVSWASPLGVRQEHEYSLPHLS